MDKTTQTALIFGGLGLGVTAFCYWLAYMIRRGGRSGAIAAIKQGQGVFLKWHYAPEDWKLAAEEYFEIKPRRMGENGAASFTESHVFVTNGKAERLYELVGPNPRVKHLTDVRLAKLTNLDALRFEVRTKTIKKGENNTDTMEEEYELETFYVPVPRAAAAEGEKVLQFYRDLLARRADAVAAVSPYGTGLFQK